MKLGVIGANGFVGTAMMKLFPNAIPFHRDSTYEDINTCEAVFVCVPTPNVQYVPGQIVGEGKLDISIVEDVVRRCMCPLIIIRSTLNPGTADYLEETYHKNISVVPEYVGETVAHPLLDEKTRPFLVIGGSKLDRRKVIEIYQSVYNANVRIRQVTNYEAEVIKLSENRSIATKVAECQELYDVCEKAGVDYYIIREAVYGDDPRMSLWWSFVYPNKRGFNSPCIPKDVYAWAAWAESLGYDPKITRAILAKNREWIT